MVISHIQTVVFQQHMGAPTSCPNVFEQYRDAVSVSNLFPIKIHDHQAVQCLHEAVGLVNDDLLSNFTLFGQWSSCQHGIAENTRTISPDMPSYSNASSHPKRRDLGPRHTIRMPRCLGR